MKTVSSESAGFSSVRLQRINHLMQGYVDRNEFAGMIATVSCKEKSIYYEKIGWMDKEAQKPMQDDAIFTIASMTKPITAVAAMMLYEEGYFNLNTPVWNFIPGFKNLKVCVGVSDDGSLILTNLKQEITFRHLFTHTAGLSYGFDGKDPVDIEYRKAMQITDTHNLLTDLVGFIDIICRLPLAFQPGTKWRYSMSIDVLGMIIEIISGIPYEKFLEEHIFKPLGMTDTAFYVSPEKMNRVAMIYGHSKPEKILSPLKNTLLTAKSPVFSAPGHGLFSTVSDYSRFCQMLVNGGELDGVRILSPTTVSLFTINHAPAEALSNGLFENDPNHTGYGYSLGTRVLMDISKTGIHGSIGEFGWDGAFSTYFWIDLKEKLYGLLMLQYKRDNDYPIHKQFKQLVYQAMI